MSRPSVPWSITSMCAVAPCENVGRYVFPKDPDRRSRWISATRIEKLHKLGWRLNTRSTVCSEHFTAADFSGPGKRLKLSAIPSIFPWTEVESTPIIQLSATRKCYSRKKSPKTHKVTTEQLESTGNHEVYEKHSDIVPNKVRPAPDVRAPIGRPSVPWSITSMCAVAPCENVGRYVFPRDPDRRSRWISATRIEKLHKLGWRLNTRSTVCSEHFTAADFSGPSKRLKLSAIPSIFPWTDVESTPIIKISPTGKCYSRKISPKTHNVTTEQLESTWNHEVYEEHSAYIVPDKVWPAPDVSAPTIETNNDNKK